MKKLKEYFSTPKKAACFIGCIITGLLLLVAVIFATANIIAHKVLIGKNEAKKIALSDAGLSASDISGSEVKLDFENGKLEYEVEFFDNEKGNEYDYHINGKNGDIVSKDIESKNGVNVLSQKEQTSDRPQDQESNPPQKSQKQESNIPQETQQQSSNQDISLQSAKSIALSDAGLSESEVTFVKEKTDTDNNIKVYDIEFYSADKEYDYEIKVSDGTIIDRDIDYREKGLGQEDIDIPENTGSEKYIGVDKAKDIAVSHANVSEQEVIFSKTKLENDDREIIYEIEFYLGQMEYEYEIDAVSGKILKYEYDER